MEITEAELDEAAYILTKFAKAINPNINEELAFDVVIEMLCDELTVETATLYGSFVRDTALGARAVQ